MAELRAEHIVDADVIRIATEEAQAVSRAGAMGGSDRKFNAGSGGEGVAGAWRASGTGTEMGPETGSTHDR